MLSFKGTIKLINDTAQVSEKFKKREFVITETNSPYPQEVIFQLTQEKVDLINDFKVGEEVEVNFNLRGRAWLDPKTNVTKYFNSLDAWKIARVGAAQPVQNGTANNSTQEFAPQMNAVVDDDLPF
ncbi:MAG TPA: DUF3127 domain-containing protein [Flavobacteriales bacterium]|nr:DUF3127 domain-containing protein [Flavobacteriales bacterium]